MKNGIGKNAVSAKSILNGKTASVVILNAVSPLDNQNFSFSAVFIAKIVNFKAK